MDIGIFSAFSPLLWLLHFDVQQGPQRGDPLGPLLFSNTVQLLLSSLELVLGFLDDFSLGGHQNQVARDVQQIIEVGVRMGLSLNVNKCEVIADPAITIMDLLLQSFERISSVISGPKS